MSASLPMRAGVRAALLAVGLSFFSSFAAAADYMLLDFTAAWCGPCQQLQPAVEQLSREGWIVRQIDVDREANLVKRWRVERLPTLVVLRDGEEIDRIVGAADAAEVRSHLEKIVGRGSQAAASSIGQLDEPTSPAASPGLDSAFAPPTLTQPSPGGSGPYPPLMPLQTASPDISRFGQTATPVMSADPMLTAVRLRVDDGNSFGFGTGTIIDYRDGQAIALTCGHLFRDGKGQSPMTVEYFVDGRLQSTAGRVLDYQADQIDMALVQFSPAAAVQVASLRPAAQPLREGESVCSIGCDHGADPTRRDSRVTKLNRYLGPPNVETSGAPVQGRSGGGLFDSAGRLTGVCYAADNQLDEGLYAAPELIASQLQRLGLSRLYDAPASPQLAVAPQLGVAPQLSAAPQLIAATSPAADFASSAPAVGFNQSSASAAPLDLFASADSPVSAVQASAMQASGVQADAVQAGGFPAMLPPSLPGGMQPIGRAVASSPLPAAAPAAALPSFAAASPAADEGGNLTVIVRTADGRQQVLEIPDADSSLVEQLRLQALPAGGPAASIADTRMGSGLR